MLANHDCFTHQIRNRLKATSMGLGLVRLLQDAGLADEARTTLLSIEPGFQDLAQESNRPRQRPCNANRLTGVSGRFSFTDPSARHEFVH
jgi:hypothetical protein